MHININSKYHLAGFWILAQGQNFARMYGPLAVYPLPKFIIASLFQN